MELHELDNLLIGKRIRALRNERSVKLERLAQHLGRANSHLSAIENGKRDAKISDLRAIAEFFGISIQSLIESKAATGRDALEIEMERIQRGPLFESLGIKPVAIRKTTTDDVIKTLITLHNELERMHSDRATSPEEARRANAQLRGEMRERNNYFPEIEKVAKQLLGAVSHSSGPLSQRLTADLAQHLGFTLHYVSDLPNATRSVTDLRNMRIYLSRQTSAGSDPRAALLQALAAFALGHKEVSSYAEFLEQRVQINYLAGALMIPEVSAVKFLKKAKEDRELAVEDLRDAFAVNYETAAHRFTNLSTEHLSIPVHFLKAHASGTVAKAYENDGVLFPKDALGTIEGQTVCARWSARQVFLEQDRLAPYHQYTDKPNGTYWCTSRIERGSQGDFSISLGTPFETVRFFRGRETKRRGQSSCPDDSCCRIPPADIAAKWAGKAYPSAIVNSSLLAAMPKGPVPGVDQIEVLQFLQSQSD